MNIQLAQFTDAGIIHNIMMQAYEEYRIETPPSSALDETPESIQAALKDDELAFLYYDEEVAVGSVRFKIEQQTVYFFRLAVIPTYRGKKIARKLILQLENYAQINQLTSLICKVRMEVPRNIHLYESIGFKMIATEMLPKPNGRQIPVATMAKPLIDEKKSKARN